MSRGDGAATWTWADGTTYVGEFKDGEVYGQGMSCANDDGRIMIDGLNVFFSSFFSFFLLFLFIFRGLCRVLMSGIGMHATCHK